MSLIERLNPLLDCDCIVYSSGFAVKQDEPVENALHLVKQKVESILENFPDRTYEKLYISGKGNFRDEVATILPYKGNRDPLHKPVHYREIREYLLDRWGAELISGKEADDALSSEQWMKNDKSTVICTIDKDLDMIPGYHYNWNRNKIYYVTLDDANRWFWMQMLTGDRADNIPGIKGVGPVRADKLLSTAPDNDYRRVVELQYETQYGGNWESAFREVATLLFMERKPGAEWNEYF